MLPCRTKPVWRRPLEDMREGNPAELPGQRQSAGVRRLGPYIHRPCPRAGRIGDPRPGCVLLTGGPRLEDAGLALGRRRFRVQHILLRNRIEDDTSRGTRGALSGNWKRSWEFAVFLSKDGSLSTSRTAPAASSEPLMAGYTMARRGYRQRK